MQMKYHVLLPSIYYSVVYFGCVLKYNHVVFFKKVWNKFLAEQINQKGGNSNFQHQEWKRRQGCRSCRHKKNHLAT